MLTTLSKYGPVINAGLLARTALSLTSNISNNQKKIVENEEQIINSIINEIALSNNLNRNNQDDVKKIIDLLDIEIDSLMTVPNKEEILIKLAEKAELPSDLYDIEVIKNIIDFYGNKYENEYERIKGTVKRPDKELHYGPPENNDQPFLISMFSKYYESEYPRNSFSLLVVGQRNKMKMVIHQVWRIYSDIIPDVKIMSLIDLLKAFSEEYGIEMELNGQKGKFFLSDTSNLNKTFNIKINPIYDKSNKKIPTSFTFSHFIQNKPASLLKQASLLVAIDLNKYKALLKERRW